MSLRKTTMTAVYFPRPLTVGERRTQRVEHIGGTGTNPDPPINTAAVVPNEPGQYRLMMIASDKDADEMQRKAAETICDAMIERAKRAIREAKGHILDPMD